jgi:DNA-binding transcriptional regulator YiaG
VDDFDMRTHSLRGALKQEVRRAVARQGKAITKRLDRTRTRLKSLRLTVRRQAAELARAQRRLTRLAASRGGAVRSVRSASGPGMTPQQIRAARGPRSRRVFAEILGVSANSIFLWETGRARPRGVNLARLERARGPKRGPGRPRGSRNVAKGTAAKRTAPARKTGRRRRRAATPRATTRKAA